MLCDRPLLFLDVDGVLNDHRRHFNGYCGMDEDKIKLVNELVVDTKCRIVLASSWRYLVLSGKMTIDGLNELFHTYGLRFMSIVGVLGREGQIADRGVLCRDWMSENIGGASGLRYAAIDDLDLGYTKHSIPLVVPPEGSGMTPACMVKLKHLLTN